MSIDNSKLNEENWCWSFVSYCINADFIGKKPELLIGSNRRNKTFLGGILSCLIFIVTFIGFLYFGQEIIYKHIPSVVLSSIIDAENNPIIIDKYNYNFLFSVKKQDVYIDLDSDYIDIKLNIRKFTRNETLLGNENSKEITIIETNPLSISSCNKALSPDNKNADLNAPDNNINVFTNLLANLNTKNYKCLDNSTEIYGSEETTAASLLEITIDQCLDIFEFLAYYSGMDINDVANNLINSSSFNSIASNVTSKGNDKRNLLNTLVSLSKINSFVYSLSEASEVFSQRKLCPLNKITNVDDISRSNSTYSRNKDLLKNALFIFKYIETNFDARSYSTIANFVLDEFKSAINYDFHKNVELYLKKIEYRTDQGYILEDFFSESFFKVTKIDEILYSNYAFKYKEPLITFRINANKIKDIYFRKYYKIQNLIAELGGLLKSFFLMALILNYFNNHAKYYEKMIDELFDVEDLFKYYQYYNSKNKIIFKKYRDSILLRNTKDMDNFKKTMDHRQRQIKLNLSKENIDMSQGNLELAKINKENFGFRSEINSNNNNTLFTNNFQKIDEINNKINTNDKLKPNVKLENYFHSQPIKLEEQINNLGQNMDNSYSDSESSSQRFINKLRKSQRLKENFYKLKKKRFSLNMFEMVQFLFCAKSELTLRKKQILSGGKSMIHEKLDVINVLKKNLEFDRFKNLMLRDYQLVLLNSLSKFMLDPERINLVDFKNCNYDKLIDSYEEALNSESLINFNLVKLIDIKFQIDKDKEQL